MKLKKLLASPVFSVVAFVLAAGLLIFSSVGGARAALTIQSTDYQGEISLDDIANSIAVSASTCTRLFKEYTNKTPIVFLNNYRLEKSAQLLRNTDDSIMNISFDCGFLQQSYFNRVFLREYGVTPKQYRNQYQNF